MINQINCATVGDRVYSVIKKPKKELSALCRQYDSVLGSILDKYAPVSTKTQKTTNSMDDSRNNEN